MKKSFTTKKENPNSNDFKILKSKISKTLNLPKNKNYIIITNKIPNSSITINENSNIFFITFLKKGWKNKRKLNFTLKGNHSKLTFIGIIIGENSNSFEFETNAKHLGKNTNSYFFIRGTMYNKSQTNYTGKIKIEKNAKSTDSYLSHKSLLLSKDASVRTIPSLEIKEKDVKVGHCATIGKLDKNSLFYLASRGIDKKTSQDMLIKAFLEYDLKKFQPKSFKKILNKELLKLFKK